MIADEGLENVIKRHQECAKRFYQGLEQLGLQPYVTDVYKRLPTVTTIKVPEDILWQDITTYAMRK